MSVFQLLPLQLSPTSSWATIAPLSLVLTVTLLKDAYLDVRRHRSDRALNGRSVLFWADQHQAFAALYWKEVQVGNVLVLYNNQPVPTDLVLLATSHSDQLSYIETANLDGESNLKAKSALAETAEILHGDTPEAACGQISMLDGSKCTCEYPNSRLYTFEGSLSLSGVTRPISIQNDNVLLRGSTLKNTK